MRAALLSFAFVACVPPREPTPISSSETAKTSAPETTVDVETPPHFVRGGSRWMEEIFWSGEPAPTRVLAMHFDGNEDDRLDPPCVALYELRRLEPIKRANDHDWQIDTAQTHEPIARQYGFSDFRQTVSYFAEGRSHKTRFFEYGIVEKGERVERYERFVDHEGKLWHATLFVQATAKATTIDTWLPLLFDAPFALTRPKERIALFGLPTRL